jgi:NodT family efflux transporter outer membrane factor (OMF) lipoprotein
MRALTCSLAAAIGLTACTSGPPYQRPALPEPPPAQYKENQPGSPEAQANGWRPANPQDALLRGKWWAIFGDPELNALEEQLTVDNQTIKQAFENYMAALVVLTGTRATLFPTVSVGLSGDASHAGSSSSATTATNTGAGLPITGTTGTNGTGATTGGSGAVLASTTRQSYSLPVSASWEPDLFGRIRSQIRENAAAAQVSAANLANETLSQQATLAETFFQLRGQDALQTLYNQTVASYQRSLQLTQTLYRTGIDSEQDVAQAETNLLSAEANASGIATTRAQYEHALALLTGRAAGSFAMPVRALSASPPAIPTGIPSQLLERRPDIAAAERTMAQANALIGVGKAAYYPTISITGSAGLQSSALTKLLSAGAAFWSLGGDAAETLLDFGARRATVRQYEAEYNGDVASYRETVLNAFKEVEDYLVASRQLAEQSARQQLALAAAQRYLQLANDRYRLGIDTYLNVLTAQNSVFSSEQQMVANQTDRMTTAVQLITAIGGGWSASDLPALHPDEQPR